MSFDSLLEQYYEFPSASQVTLKDMGRSTGTKAWGVRHKFQADSRFAPCQWETSLLIGRAQT